MRESKQETIDRLTKMLTVGTDPAEVIEVAYNAGLENASDGVRMGKAEVYLKLAAKNLSSITYGDMAQGTAKLHQSLGSMIEEFLR